MPFFSVIIPTYNRDTILPRAIESVVNQTFDDWELIIVDDGSTDNTFSRLSNFLLDERIKYYKQENGGVCVARNKGADMASGLYLLFLDSDDFVAKDWMCDFFDEVFKSQADIVCCNSKMNSTEVINTDSFLAGNFTVKRALFLQAGKYDVNLKFGENTELKWRLDAIATNIKQISNSNFFYDNSGVFMDKRKKENQIAFTYYVLIKHSVLFHKNRRWIQLICQIAGVNCIQLGRMKEGKELLWKGYMSNPLHLKSLLRVVKYNLKITK